MPPKHTSSGRRHRHLHNAPADRVKANRGAARVGRAEPPRPAAGRGGNRGVRRVAATGAARSPGTGRRGSAREPLERGGAGRGVEQDLDRGEDAVDLVGRPRDARRPSRIASVTSMWPSRRSCTVRRSVVPSPSTSRSAGLRDHGAIAREPDVDGSSSSVIRARRSSTAARRRSRAGRVGARRAVDEHAARTPRACVQSSRRTRRPPARFPRAVRRRRWTPRYELADELVDEAVAALGGVGGDQLRAARARTRARPCRAVVGAQRARARRRGVGTVPCSAASEPGRRRARSPAGPSSRSRRSRRERTPAAARARRRRAAGRRVACSRSVVRLRINVGPGSAATKAAPLPAEVVAPVPPAPVVIVVRGRARETRPRSPIPSTRRRRSAGHRIPRDPTGAERLPQLHTRARARATCRDVEPRRILGQPRRTPTPPRRGRRRRDPSRRRSRAVPTVASSSPIPRGSRIQPSGTCRRRRPRRASAGPRARRAARR